MDISAFSESTAVRLIVISMCIAAIVPPMDMMAIVGTRAGGNQGRPLSLPQSSPTARSEFVVSKFPRTASSKGLTKKARSTVMKRDVDPLFKLTAADFRELFQDIEYVQTGTKLTLELWCQRMEVINYQLPKEYAFPDYTKNCIEYARDLADTKKLQCAGAPSSQPATTYTSAQKTVKDVATSLNVYDSLMQAVKQLPNWRPLNQTICISAVRGSPDFAGCTLEMAHYQIVQLRSKTMTILKEVGVLSEIYTGTFDCQVNLSIAMKFPLAILWRIQAELEPIAIQTRIACYKVKVAQSDITVSCD